eukprot:17833-Heterococcus_DN1.PRE.1
MRAVCKAYVALHACIHTWPAYTLGVHAPATRTDRRVTSRTIRGDAPLRTAQTTGCTNAAVAGIATVVSGSSNGVVSVVVAVITVHSAYAKGVSELLSALAQCGCAVAHCCSAAADIDR